MAAIEVAGLVVQRGGEVILDHLDLTVPEGTVTGLLGPNGSGKTTLLRSIVGAQRITAGTIRALGHRPDIPRCAPRSATPRRPRRCTAT